MSGSRESLNKLTKNYQQPLGPSPPYPLLALSTWRPSRRPISRQSLAGVMKNRRTEWRSRRRATSPLTSKTDTDAHDPFAALTSPRPRRAPGVRPHPHDLLQDLPVSSGMFDERAGDNAAPKLSGGLSLGPLSSRRIQVSVCGRARKTHLRFTYKGFAVLRVLVGIFRSLPTKSDEDPGPCPRRRPHAAASKQSCRGPSHQRRRRRRP